MEIKALEEIGLTVGESKVYLALTRLGLCKTGKLAKEASVSSSKVYKILDRLEKKGLVGFIMKGKVKNYRAMEPRNIIRYIEEKERELEEKKKVMEELLPKLEKELENAGKQPEAAIYFGYKGVTNIFNNLREELKKGETYYVMGAGYGFHDVEKLKDFFHIHHKKRAEKKIRVKMLANHDVRESIIEPNSWAKELRFLPQNLITNMEIVIYRNKVAIIIFAVEPYVFLIESKEVSSSFMHYFNTLWKISKK
ncbi:MAG: helix-turn-helix domain-containing protein [Nanoarchaeota archaeon]